MYANLGVCAGEWHSKVLARFTHTYAQRPRTHKDYLPILLDFWPGQQAIRLVISHSQIIKNAIHDHSHARGYAATCIGIDFLSFLCEASRRRVGTSTSRLLAACSRMCRHKCHYSSVRLVEQQHRCPYFSQRLLLQKTKNAESYGRTQPQASASNSLHFWAALRPER